MECCNKIWKILAALVAVTATVLVVIKFWDKILEAAGELQKKVTHLKKEHGACGCEDFLV